MFLENGRLTNGSVRVMRSYDYNHFEVTLGTDEKVDLKTINEMRKDAQLATDTKSKQKYRIEGQSRSGKNIGNIDAQRYDLLLEMAIKLKDAGYTIQITDLRTGKKMWPVEG
jgi:hypothetical protein